MTFTHALSTNNYGPAKFIVSANAYEGTHTTIASALTAASSGDTIFIRPGTYTENPTLKAGVNLSAYPCDAMNGNVIILGKCTATFVGQCALSGIRLKTNSDYCLAVTGSSATVVRLVDCWIDVNNNNAINLTSSSSSSFIWLEHCRGDTDTTGISYFDHSGAGALKFDGGQFENNGLSSTASTVSGAGAVNFFGSYFGLPITTSSTAVFRAENSSFIISGTLTLNGTGATNLDSCQVSSGSNSAISVGTGATAIVNLCRIDSTNTNAITGAGTINHGGIVFTASSSKINTTTQGSLPIGFAPTSGGTVTTNALSTYEQGTFTPGLTFGGGSTNITYNNQTGKYTRIGNVVNFEITVGITSKGTSTGSAKITGLPKTVSGSGQYAVIFNSAGITYPTNFLTIFMNPDDGATTASLVASASASVGSGTNLADTNFANSTTIQMSGFYFAS